MQDDVYNIKQELAVEYAKYNKQQQRARPILEQFSEFMGEQFGRIEKKHKVEIAELRAETARLRADVAALRAAPLGDFEKMLDKFEARIASAIRRVGEPPPPTAARRLVTNPSGKYVTL